MTTKKPVPIQTQYRDSDNGQFTTKEIAKQRPRETEKERIKHPTPPAKKP